MRPPAQMLEENGVVPFKPALPHKRRGKVAVSRPAAVQICAPPRPLSPPLPQDGQDWAQAGTVIIRRGDAENQRLYIVRPTLLPAATHLPPG
jgi:hypothetical protein